jgi:hypothetical protein
MNDNASLAVTQSKRATVGDVFTETRHWKRRVCLLQITTVQIDICVCIYNDQRPVLRETHHYERSVTRMRVRMSAIPNSPVHLTISSLFYSQHKPPPLLFLFPISLITFPTEAAALCRPLAARSRDRQGLRESRPFLVAAPTHARLPTQRSQPTCVASAALGAFSISLLWPCGPYAGIWVVPSVAFVVVVPCSTLSCPANSSSALFPVALES